MAFNDTMAEALRLTREGNLHEATALLQATLGGVTARAPTAAGPVIDLMPQTVRVAARGARTTPAADPRFEERTHRAGTGTIRYRLYRPATPAAGMPLVVMLHGCTQSPEDFARGTGMNLLADELGFFVAYPAQNPSANPQKCWNWFKPGDQRRDAGEPALLAAITREVIAEHGIDPARVYVAGMSAGGAAAAIMAAEYPDLYAAVGIHSGIGCGAARDMPSALTAMKRGGARGARGFTPVITFHGDRDTTVDAVNSREIVAAAAVAAGVPLEQRVEQGRGPAGRAYSRELSSDPRGTVVIEQWTVEGSGHAWSGGNRAGSYTDPQGPDASREMLRFFLSHRLGVVTA